ncbi:SAM-dependent methyltransferase [Amycolatopsis anabasis]|uniref:SAM-dependent methyltransferase n=1 Tax=Amycolatopsis anabasis TaxID=1840409 RepID=UPI00131E7E67|nr:SAM-dependent methyltransferase [Amycolatopsis anabasis]
MPDPNDSAPAMPSGVDTEKPSAARMYDWYLGGTQNWAVDREFGKKVVQLWPHVREVAKQNRRFLRRAVTAALDAGIRQFVDLGSGVPTVGNVHEIVREHLPAGERATVVYVDYEPVAVAHATLILEQDEATDWATIVQEDLRAPKKIFDHAETKRLIDLDQPVCLLLIAVLHFVGGDDRPEELLERYRRRVAPGSWLALTHIACEEADEEDQAAVRRFADAYRDTSNPLWVRERDELAPWFGDWSLVEPGITHLPDWRPDYELTVAESTARPFAWCGVARKPGD